MRIKALCIVCLFILIGLQVKAQANSYSRPGYQSQDQTNTKQNNTSNTDHSDSYVGTSIGISLPLGNLSTTSSSDWSGFARDGFNVNISAGIDLYKTFGVAGIIGYYRNAYDMKTFLYEVAQANPGIYSGPSVKAYTSECFMAGLFKTTKLNQKTWIDFRLLAGIVVTSFPNPRWTIDIGGTSTQYGIDVLASSQFGFDIGIGTRYELGKRIYLMFNLDFLYSSAPYTGIFSATSSGQTSSELLSGRLEVSYMTLNAGVAYQIFR